MTNNSSKTSILAGIILCSFFFSCNTTSSDSNSEENSNDEQIPMFSLTTSSTPEEAGTVEPESGEFQKGSNVEIEAISNRRYKFSNWEGDTNGTVNPITVLMESDRNVTAVFEQTVFPKTYGGFRDDAGWSLLQTSDGGFIITGATNSKDGDFPDKNNNELEGFILKTDSSGKKQWVNTTGFRGLKVLESGDGGYVMLNSETGGPKTLTKFNSSGNKIWEKVVGSGRLISMTKTSDGGYAITGEDSRNILLIKTNSTGIVQWEQTYGGTFFDSGWGVVESRDGGFLITGSTDSNDGDFEGMNNGDNDIALLRTNSNGELLWTKTFGGKNSDTAGDIIKTGNDGYAIVGETDSNDGDFSGGIWESCGGSCSGGYVLKINSQAEMEWVTGFSKVFGFDKVTQTSDGGFAMASGFARVVKFDSRGNLLWEKGYNGNSRVRSVIQLRESGLAITGSTTADRGIFADLNKGESDIFLIRTDSEGNIY